MNHQQWLEWRRGGIGSSDAPVIIGISPWKTKYQLWEEKLTGKTLQAENASMIRGRELEEVARDKFEKIMNISVFSKNCTHKSIPWMRASLDGIDIDEKIMVEIKCPNREDHSLAVMKKIPSKYFPQCQHQLMVTGLDTMFYYSFDGREGVVVEVQKDQNYIDMLWEEEHKFWEMKEKKIPPELTEKDYICMDDNSEWKKMVSEWNIWKKEATNAEEKEKYFKEKIISLSGNRNAFGSGIQLNKCISAGRIDIQALMKEYPDLDWDRFRKDPFPKFTIKNI